MPLHATLQLRPSLQHIDAADDARRASMKQEHEEDPMLEEPQGVQVRTREERERGGKGASPLAPVYVCL